MFFFLFLSTFFSTVALAGPTLVNVERRFHSDKSWTEKGKFLEQDFSATGDLLQEREDRNHDGQFDTWITYRKNGEIVREYDQDGDGNIEKREESNVVSNRRLTLVYRKTGKDFQFSHSYYESIIEELELSSVEKDCLQYLEGQNLERFYQIQNLLGNLTSSLQKKYGSDDWITNGFEIDQYCFSQFGKEFILKNLQESVLNGTACMLLNSRNGSADEILQKIQSLLTNPQKKVRISCSTETCWDRTLAYGSLPGSKDHPRISISPYSDEAKKDKNLFQSTIFHELLHNCGYQHSHDVDYSYSCDNCCDSHISLKRKTKSCEICGGVYKDPTDPKYLKALADWAKEPNAYWNSNRVSAKAALTQMFTTGKRSIEMKKAVLYAIDGTYGKHIAMALLEDPTFIHPDLIDPELAKIKKLTTTGYKRIKIKPIHRQIAKLIKFTMDGDVTKASIALSEIPTTAADDLDIIPLLYEQIEADIDANILRFGPEKDWGAADRLAASNLLQAKKRIKEYYKSNDKLSSEECKYPWPPKAKGAK